MLQSFLVLSIFDTSISSQYSYDPDRPPNLLVEQRFSGESLHICICFPSTPICFLSKALLLPLIWLLKDVPSIPKSRKNAFASSPSPSYLTAKQPSQAEVIIFAKNELGIDIDQSMVPNMDDFIDPAAEIVEDDEETVEEVILEQILEAYDEDGSDDEGVDEPIEKVTLQQAIEATRIRILYEEQYGEGEGDKLLQLERDMRLLSLKKTPPKATQASLFQWLQ